MLKKRLVATFIATALLVIGWIAGIEMAVAQTRDQLVEKYTPLAGSEANAKTLVSGLRDGKDFTINGTTFKTPTGKMGNGEVNIALAIAEKELGTSTPTTTQLQGALVGTSSKPGILAMRAEHMGWGQIAQAYGFKLGEVMRSEKAESHAKLDRPERPVKHERPERPEKPERPGR